jgi:hypothetical protein
MTVHVVLVLLQDLNPGVAVTLYPVIGDAPLGTGGVHET